MEIDPRKWKKLLFYIDLVVIGIFIISLVFLVEDAYMAGHYFSSDKLECTIYLWHMIRDTAFLVASLAWIFYRFFRNEYLLSRRPW
jgi:hypothetical protein